MASSGRRPGGPWGSRSDWAGPARGAGPARARSARRRLRPAAERPVPGSWGSLRRPAATCALPDRLAPVVCSPLPLPRSEEHTSELQSRQYLVCRLLLEKKKNKTYYNRIISDIVLFIYTHTI